MTFSRGKHLRPGRRLLCVLLLGAATGPAAAQDGLGFGTPAWREPVLDRSFRPLFVCDQPAANGCSGCRASRVHLFRMPCGFLYEPVGLDSDDPPPEDPLDPKTASGGPDSTPVQVVMGLDNPYFDYRLPTDPGGLGYYKVHTQLQLLDQGKTSLCLGLQAYTPAGLEMRGLAGGPTVLNPTVAWFQDLGQGAALQGFVGKNIRAGAGWTDELESNVEYGMALQYALPGLTTCPKHNFLFFMEALGRYRINGEAAPGKPMNWEFIPGIHWRVGDNWALSVGAARKSLITFSWQF